MSKEEWIQTIRLERSSGEESQSAEEMGTPIGHMGREGRKETMGGVSREYEGWEVTGKKGHRVKQKQCLFENSTVRSMLIRNA